ncbi:MAG: zinc-dependent metalloprotease family protein [Pseudomonadota bacterium]
MNRLARLAALPCLVATAAAHGGDITLTKYDRLDAGDIAAADLGQRRALSFAASGREWSLRLTPNARLTAALPEQTSTRVFKGEIDGRAGSWVRLSERDGRYRGLIFDGTDYYALERAADTLGDADTGGLVFYSLKDAVIDGGAMSCGLQTTAGVGEVTLQSEFKALNAELAALAAGASQSIDIGVIADSQFNDQQADPGGALTDRLNIIDGIFSEQLGVALSVAETRIFDDASDPLPTDENDAEALLRDHLAPLKGNDATLRALGLVHLYTGRDLDTSTVGIAFRGVLCQPVAGVGLSEGRRTLTIDALIAAHEIGHNFDAPHDGEAGSACESTSTNFLMAPSLNGSSTFSSCSQNFMRAEVAAAACVVALEPIDVQTIFTGVPTDAEVGESFGATLRVVNGGSDPSGSVAVALTVPAALALDTASLPAACTAAVDGAACTLGPIAGGSQATLAFQFAAAAADSSADIVATATTAGDANTANDSISQRVVVADGADNADLGVEVSGAASLVDGDQASYTVTVANAGPNASMSTELSISLPSTLDYVSDDRDECVPQGTGLQCSFGDLGAGGDEAVIVDVRAQTTGAGSIDANAATSTNDTDAGNDSDSLTVTVNAAQASGGGGQSSGGGGGGGSTGLLLVTCLTVGAALRRRRRRG